MRRGRIPTDSSTLWRQFRQPSAAHLLGRGWSCQDRGCLRWRRGRTSSRRLRAFAIVSSVLIVALLLLVYRSVTALLLGLVPVVSGALVGIAAVALGFGVVQGVTLGFGVTLIGEGVDYSIYSVRSIDLQ